MACGSGSGKSKGTSKAKKSMPKVPKKPMK